MSSVLRRLDFPPTPTTDLPCWRGVSVNRAHERGHTKVSSEDGPFDVPDGSAPGRATLIFMPGYRGAER